MKISQLSLTSLASSVAAKNLFVSSYGGNITSLRLNSTCNGTYSLEKIWSNPGSSPSPSWLEKDPYKDNLIYCVDENLSGGNGSIASYHKGTNGKLTLMDRHSTLNSPVSTIVYNKGKALVAAMYGGSAIQSYFISTNGTLTPSQTFTFQLPPSHPPTSTQAIPHPHQVLLDPTESFILIPDLGADVLRIYSINPTTSLLTPQPSFSVSNGTGPRHGQFLHTPCGETYLFIVTELKPTISSYRVTYTASNTTANTTMALEQVFTSSIYGPEPPTLPAVVPGGPYPAEIVISPCGTQLLTSVRGDNIFNISNPDPSNHTLIPSDSLQVWDINPTTGNLAFKQLAPAGGSWPRQMSMNKKGDLVAVALQHDDRVVLIKRSRNGTLGGVVAQVDVVGEVSSVIWDD